MYLEELTTSQAKKVLNDNAIIVIPIGSIEQHGNQCALGTDYIIPRYLGEQISHMEKVVVLPAIPYGVCPYHLNFAGSIDIGYEGLKVVLEGITRSLMKHGAKRFLILNGHGGNSQAIEKVALEVYQKGGVCALIDWWSLVAKLDSKFVGGHGDILETSAMMAIDEKYVDLSLAEDITPINPTEKLKASYIQAVSFNGGIVKIPRNTEEIAPQGWFGPISPKESSVEFGREALKCAAEFIEEFIEEYKKMELR